jgi:molecular chaperone DnaJ
LDGYQTVQLPQGTESGWVCRLPGAGAPGCPGLPPGDQVMEIVVTTAHDFYPRQEELLEEVYRLGSERQTGVGHE